MYSQNGEDEVIYRYFGDTIGHLLDIGANDGVTLSNSRALIELGWHADLVEPSPKAFERLYISCVPIYDYGTIGRAKFNGIEWVEISNYSPSQFLSLYNFAIGPETGKWLLHESDSHNVKGGRANIGLLSTLVPDEKTRWGNTQVFTPVEVDVFRFEDTPLAEKKYDFITIDAEGMDFEILQQIDLKHTAVVCIEHNNRPGEKERIMNYCSGFHLLHENAENIILAK